MINELTHKKSIPKLPSRSTEDLLEAFSAFFVQKIQKITRHHSRVNSTKSRSGICASTSVIKNPKDLQPCNKRRNRKDYQGDKINILPIRRNHNRSPQTMPFGPSPVITQMINVSLSSGQFP